MQRIRGVQDIVIEVDINKYIGSDRTDYGRVHKRYGFGKKNEAGEKYLILHQRIN